jgi:transcriptional regulator with PAS, ATPase and Fis domain
MERTAIALESLLETHDAPFWVIGADAKVAAINKAGLAHFGATKAEIVERPCCVASGQECRHQRFFKTLERYAGIFLVEINGELQDYRVNGYPLLDNQGTLFLGESLIPQLNASSTEPVMIGSSEVFKRYKSKLKQAAISVFPVLLNGETGTGKELAAEFIHSQSAVAEGNFVIVDCTSLSGDLFESELFGHEKGAFTGATGSKKGLFELANQGTLFLDEIGELPLSQQPKLLRAMESGQFRRVGGVEVLKSEVRVVCATHRDLGMMVKKGQFREDLFYRLSVFPIQIPTLRERKTDLPLLIDYFLKLAGARGGVSYSMSKPALLELLKHDWPGNVRELKNCIQLAADLQCGTEIALENINILRQSDLAMPEVSSLNEKDLMKNINPLDRLEVDFINDLNKKYSGNRKLMANEMNISERTLYRKLKRYNLN